MAAQIVGRCALTTARRCLFRIPVATMASDGGIPDYYEHSTGIERAELDLLKKGVEDPFSLKTKKVAKGTREKPIIVESAFDKRIIGCICDEEQTFINWMWLHEGEAQRCRCGGFYKLKRVDPIMKGHGGGH